MKERSAKGAGPMPLGRSDALCVHTVTAQSIFQAEKITLGTAGSPAGFL
jgi:hypothetical protein